MRLAKALRRSGVAHASTRLTQASIRRNGGDAVEGTLYGRHSALAP